MRKMFTQKVRALRTMGALTLTAVLLSVGAQAATYYVTPTGAGAGDGTSWSSATANLQLAIDSCATHGGGEVWVKAGTYKPSATLKWKDSVNVYGGFAGTETNKSQRSLDAALTVLDGDGAKLIAQKDGVTSEFYKKRTTWSGLTLYNGKSTYSGGIYLYPNMTLDNVIISSCVATSTGNYGGGAISIAPTAESNDTIIVRNCRIVGNTAQFGGGISVGAPNNTGEPIKTPVLIENTEIINNKANNRGGGITVEPKAGSTKGVTIRSCVVANNSSGSNSGGGISLFRVNAQIINTTIAGNVAGNWGGGGLYANSVDTLTVLNSIFWNNEDAQNAIGSHTILSQGKGAKDSVVVIKNSIFAPALQVGVDVQNNIKLTVVDTITVSTQNSGSAVGVKYVNFRAPSSAAGYAASDENKLNADWSLAQGSAAIDAGITVTGLAADIVGRSRPTGAGVDIGAYEYAAPITIASGAAVSTDYTASHGDVIFEADTTSGVGQWTAATTAVTNGTIKLAKTFKTNKTYAIGFPFDVAAVRGAGYELKSYSNEYNLFVAASAIEAGKGYLIKFPAERDTILTVTFTSVRNPTLATPPALGAGEYALVANATLQSSAAGIAGAQNYYVFSTAADTFAAPSTSPATLKPFEAVLATAATADLLAPAAIGKGNAAAPSVTLTADSGITVVTPKDITYPYVTADPFVATFTVAVGYTNVRAIVSVAGVTEPDTTSLTPVSGIYTVARTIKASTSIRLTADTIRSTLTISAGEGVKDVSITGSVEVGYFDSNTWFTFKTLDGYHTPRVMIGNSYREVKKGAGGVDTVFLEAVTSNVTVTIAAFRDNTAPVLYDLHVNQAGAVTATGNSMQIMRQGANFTYSYLKFDVKDALQGNGYDRVTLRVQMSANGSVQNAKPLLLQWVSNNSNNGGDINTDGNTPWDNSFTYAGRPVAIKDSVSIKSVGTAPGTLVAQAIEFAIDDPAVIARIKDSIAAGNTELSFRIDPTADNVIIMANLYSSEGSTGDNILIRTPQLIFSAPTYNIAVRNDARNLITLTSPSASDTTYTVKHDSALVLKLTVKKGYEPVVQGYGKLTGTPSITNDVTYTLSVDKARANDTIRLSADVIRFNVAVEAPNGHVTIIQPSAGRSPYKVANDSAFALSFKVDAEYIPTVTVSSDLSYALGDSASDGSYTVRLPKVNSNVAITIAADLTDSVTIRVAKHDSVTIVSPTLAEAYRVARDSAFTLTFTLAEGYDVSVVKINGAAAPDSYVKVNGEEYTFTIPKVAASSSVSIEAAIRKYRIVLTPIGVTIAEPTGANPHSIDHNGSLTVKVAIAEGYYEPVKLVRLDGSIIAATPSGNEYVATIPNITANDSILVTADDGKRRIAIRKDSRVTLVGATDTVLEASIGKAFEVTFTVPAGHTPQVVLEGSNDRITTLPAASGAANTYTSKIGTVSSNATIVINLAAATGIADVDLNDPVTSVRYYNLQGQEVRQPSVTGIYILRKQHLSGRVTMEKRLIVED